MTQHGMGDEATIKEIISEVDADNVSQFKPDQKNLSLLVSLL